jgi:hypothetical protein
MIVGDSAMIKFITALLGHGVPVTK